MNTKIHESTEAELIRNHAGLIVDLQSDLLRAVGEADWNLDVEKARIHFKDTGDAKSYRVSFIGSYSEVTDTWLWADVNRSLQCPRAAVAGISAIREAGRAAGLPLLIEDQFGMDGAYGPWDIAYLAAALLLLPAYRCPHENGMVFIGVEEVPRGGNISIAEFAERFRRSTSLLLYNAQEEALRKYACLHGFEIIPVENGYRVSSGGESRDFQFKGGFLR